MTRRESEALLQTAEMLERRVLAMLAALTRARNVGARELDRRTGFASGSNTWSKIFRGERRLKILHVYQALLAIGVEPEDFFTAVHPPTEEPEEKAPATLTAREVLTLLQRTGSLGPEAPDGRRTEPRKARSR